MLHVEKQMIHDRDILTILYIYNVYISTHTICLSPWWNVFMW